MLSRRHVIMGGAVAVAIGPPAMANAADDFARLLKDTEDNPADSTAAKADAEGREASLAPNRGAIPRSTRSTRHISDDAVRLIIASEVTGQRHYGDKLRWPALPPAPSGLTIGIGYDLGYSKLAWIDDEWSELQPAVRARLKTACGKKGGLAAPFKHSLHDITIDWPVALGQFQRVQLPLWIGATEHALPNTAMLSDDCLGALVDLVYNRGAGGFFLPGPRYTEMRRVHQMMIEQDFDGIADQLDAMAALWGPTARTPQPGNVRRRHAEAALFRKGRMA